VQRPAASAMADARLRPEDVSFEMLRTIGAGRRPFPHNTPLQIGVIYPVGSKASILSEFSAQLAHVLSLVQITHMPTNMHEPEALAKAIHDATGEILVIIRGGGDSLDFAVFDDPNVVTALAQKAAFRVIGIGHANTKTILDLVCESSVETPRAAGVFLRDAILQNRYTTVRAKDLEGRLIKSERYRRVLTGSLIVVIIVLTALLIACVRR